MTDSLKQKIIERIKTEGPINFETFMEMALYYPGLGYYMKNATTIGKAGDYYTSPHLHPVFGAVIGRQMEEMWEFMGSPDFFEVVEMGAGMGYLAKDMLEYLKGKGQSAKGKAENIFSHLRYTIVELNPVIQSIQQELLAEFADKVRWVSNLNELQPITGCFLSNELLDAFPVRIVEMDDELTEIHVSVSEDKLMELKKPCSARIKEYFRDYNIVIPNGYRSEVNLYFEAWIKQISQNLSSGFVLTIDYGYPAWDYYSEDRSRGTLLCYYQHQINENPYQNIGEQDLTAHVNYSSLKKWGENLGLKTIGFCPQGIYLVSMGIDELISELHGNSPDAFETAKIRGLLLPQGMGESHKVMIQYKGTGEPKLRGFKIRNRMDLL